MSAGSLEHDGRATVRVPTFAISTSVRAALIVSALLALWLMAAGHADYPNLNVILDTAAPLLAIILALLLTDIVTRLDQVFPRWVAVSFAVTALAGLVHVLVTVEWFGRFAPISASQDLLRPATWPLAGHLLPLGLLASMLMRGRALPVRWLAGGLFLSLLALFALFTHVPRYVAPMLFGITRP